MRQPLSYLFLLLLFLSSSTFYAQYTFCDTIAGKRSYSIFEKSDVKTTKEYIQQKYPELSGHYFDRLKASPVRVWYNEEERLLFENEAGLHIDVRLGQLQVNGAFYFQGASALGGYSIIFDDPDNTPFGIYPFDREVEVITSLVAKPVGLALILRIVDLPCTLRFLIREVRRGISRTVGLFLFG